MDSVDTSHRCYLRTGMWTVLGVVNVMNNANHSDILKVCLESEVANITHKVCHIIDTAKELQKSGQGHTGTVNAGVFVFPIAMAPDFKKIEGCIYVSDISSCDTNVLDTGHGLVMHLDTHQRIQ